MKLIHAISTDPGRVRSHNEDAAVAAAGLGAYVVCDGMGGAAAGEVASRMAIESLLKDLAESSPAVAENGKGGVGLRTPQTRLQAAVHAANEAVYGHSVERQEFAGMGTTLVALLHVDGPGRDRRLRPRAAKAKYVSPPTLFLANVGDSRCYRRRGRMLQQLSTDHSFVEEQVLAGQITAEQAETSPMRNYITRAIGPQAHVEPDVQGYRPEAGDLYLLASDGLTRELTDAEISRVLASSVPGGTVTSEELQVGCEALIDAANARGGRDNITVLLLALF